MTPPALILLGPLAALACLLAALTVAPYALAAVVGVLMWGVTAEGRSHARRAAHIGAAVFQPAQPRRAGRHAMQVA